MPESSPSPAAAPTPPPVLAVLARYGWLLVVGYGACLLCLLVPFGDPGPVRSLVPELRSLTLFYPLFTLFLVVHVRRREPGLMGAALGLFVTATVLRVGYLAWVTHNNLLTMPYALGTGGSDASWFDIFGRMVVQAWTGQDLGVREALQRSLSVNAMRIGQLSGIGSADTALRHTFEFSIAVIIWLCGYSVVAVVLPFSLIGSFWVTQTYVFLCRFGRQSTAVLVAVCMLALPHLLFHSSWTHKDQVTGVMLLYALEMGVSPRPWSWSRQLRCLLVLLPVAFLFRHFLVAFYGAIWAYGQWRRRLVAPERWHRVDWLAVGAFAAMVWVAGRGSGGDFETAPASPVAYAFGMGPGLWLAPGPSLLWLPNPQSLLGPLRFAAVLWPLLGGLMTIGIVLYARGRMRLHPLIVVAGLWFNCMNAAVSVKWLLVQKRETIEPLIYAFAFEALMALRHESLSVRRKLLLLAIAVTIALTVLHVLMGTYLYTLRPYWSWSFAGPEG